MTRRILVTGSRNWTDRDALALALMAHTMMAHAVEHEVIVVHGDCPTGADAMAGQWARECAGVTEEAHPADWATHGKAAGPMRNQAMVDLGADICLAFPLGESRGTRDCMRRAVAAGIDLRVFEGGEL